MIREALIDNSSLTELNLDGDDELTKKRNEQCQKRMTIIKHAQITKLKTLAQE